MAPAPTTPALAVDRVTKRYGAVTALHEVGFEVAAGTIHALVGANGSGKSTLVEVVAGVERAELGGALSVFGRPLDPARGAPSAAHRAGVRVVHQRPTLFAGLTVAENVGIGGGLPTGRGGRVRWRQADELAASCLARLGLDVSPRTSVERLPPAVQVLVAVARALVDTDEASSAPRLFLLDEPTAALPAREVDVLLAGLRRLAEHGHAVVLVTHRLDEVGAAADVATVLRDGRQVGTFVVGSVPPGQVVEMITGGPDVAVGSGGDRVAGASADPPVLEVDDLHVGGLAGVSLTVGRGEVVGVAGLLGSGRSTLLEGLFGVRRPRHGLVRLDGRALDLRTPRQAMRAGLALVPEQRARAVFATGSVAENLSIAELPRWWRRGRLDRAGERRAAAHDLERFGIVAASPRAPVDTLSGGNQQKVVIARWLRRSPRLLLLDEPTLGVDVGARAEIHALVRRYVAEQGAGALVVSSDAGELGQVADRILVLRSGRVAHELPGDADPRQVERLAHQEVLA